MEQASYFKQMQRGSYTITVMKNRCSLHLSWRARLPGDRWSFEGITITEMNLAILKESDLLQKLSSIPLNAYPTECEQLLKSWGMVEKSPQAF
jgi:hypothetical protein